MSSPQIDYGGLMLQRLKAGKKRIVLQQAIDSKVDLVNYWPILTQKIGDCLNLYFNNDIVLVSDTFLSIFWSY